MRPSDRFLIGVEDEKTVLHLQPRSYTEYLRGLHKEVWEGIDPAGYIREEKNSWE